MAGKKKERSRTSRTLRTGTGKKGGKLRRFLFAAGTIAIVAVVVGFLVLRSSNGVSLFENIFGTVLRPVESAFSSATRSVKEFFTDWHSYDTLRDEYELLAMENEKLSLRLSGMEETEIENERLSALLGASESYDTLDPIYASVIARDPGAWFDTFTIDRGTGDGVTEGMSVVTGDGLVGYVAEAGLSYAKVMTIADARSAVACLVQRTRDNGVMRGQMTSSSEHAECYVYYLPNVNNIIPGDVIVTSGTDALYPKGLTIGEVIAVSKMVGADGAYVVVSPYADFAHIESVLVLRTVTRSDASLPVVATPTPVPAVTAKITPAPTDEFGNIVEPTVDTGIWYPPTMQPEPGSATPTPAPTRFEVLPEDLWAGD